MISILCFSERRSAIEPSTSNCSHTPLAFSSAPLTALRRFVGRDQLHSKIIVAIPRVTTAIDFSLNQPYEGQTLAKHNDPAEHPAPSSEHSLVAVPLYCLAVDFHYDDTGNAAAALGLFQREFGSFRRIVTVGDSASIVADRLMEAGVPNEVVAECETLILIVRGADLASALMSAPMIEGAMRPHRADNIRQVGRVELHEGEPYFRTLRFLSFGAFRDWTTRFEE
jgi:hypothetical protein